MFIGWQIPDPIALRYAESKCFTLETGRIDYLTHFRSKLSISQSCTAGQTLLSSQQKAHVCIVMFIAALPPPAGFTNAKDILVRNCRSTRRRKW
jgi:hypothetical protein